MQGPLTSGSLSKVAVVVLGVDRAPLERFVFEPQVGQATQPAGHAARADAAAAQRLWL
jgi:hypothetical protein